jgi:dynein assembly factor with WDR repeat domains 1
MAFNVPFGDKIVTGSFDRTAKLWDSNTGDLLHTLVGHTMEIV